MDRYYALHWIKDAFKRKSTELYLSDSTVDNFIYVPREIGRLDSLEELAISGNTISEIPQTVGNLQKLQCLMLTSNKLTELPDEISKLVNLKHLWLLGNFSAFPSVICALKNLESFTFFNIRSISNISCDISSLKKLIYLDIGIGLHSLPPEIGLLRQLRFLRLSGNNIESLPSEIGQLENLEYLSLGKAYVLLPTQDPFLQKSASYPRPEQKPATIKILPDEIKSLHKLKYLDLRKTLVQIPLEILEKPEEPQAIINFYFSLRDKRDKPLSETKILIVGQGGVGKTSLVRSIQGEKFDGQENMTEGIAINRWQVDCQPRPENAESKIVVNIWDFGGQDIMHATHQFFLTKRSLYLLVLDARLTQEENRVEYWLKIIQSYGGESPVLIIGNKIDQKPLDIDRKGLKKKYSNIIGILETSAATSVGIQALKATIAEQVNALPHVHDLLPETWFRVKTELEDLGHSINFITHDRYLELCSENDVDEDTNQRTLIGFLHDLGVVLYFQDEPSLEALGILNPQWVTNGVYKILNSPTLLQNKGVLTTTMLDEILNLPEYPRGKRLFIINMMRKFELCYDLEPDKVFLVPDLLPKDESEGFDFDGLPAFQYQYPVLPSSVVTRFIVRLNSHIHNNVVWRNGVLMQIGENRALVKADFEERQVSIAIDGPEHTRRDALAAIRYQFDEIHASIKGLNPQKRIPIPGAPGAEPLEYEYLLMLEQAGDENYRVKDGGRLVTVNIRQLLSGIESEARRKESQARITNIYAGGNVVVANDHAVAIGGDADDNAINVGQES